MLGDKWKDVGQREGKVGREQERNGGNVRGRFEGDSGQHCDGMVGQKTKTQAQQSWVNILIFQEITIFI